MSGIPKYARKASKQSYEKRMTQLELEDGLRYIARLRDEDNALGLDVPTAAGRVVTSGYPGVWAASKPRLRCHGAAAMPPTPEAAEDLANGLIPATVLWTPRRGAKPRVEDLTTFTSNREPRQARQAVKSDVAETAAAAVQPALRHDYTS